MAYTALYRKLRPKTFDDIIGQAGIVKTLKNQIAQERIPHAYLFCGTRGTGKTSTAKVFAKAVNCKSPENGGPCNKCEACISIMQNRSMDVIEIDAASNNSVDDVRNLREEVKYPPVDVRYKVYIIDEVHMLSTSAFNALLKTLEEPPPHVIFILATTDPQKIPVTILSRCQRFDFKRITLPDMTDAIKRYIDAENFSVTEDALKYIASVSDGAMRDALSLFDQCSAMYFDEEITVDKVLNVVGAVNRDVFFKFADSLNSFKIGDIMQLIEKIVTDGRDITQFASDAVTHFRNLLIAKTTDNPNAVFDLSSENVQLLKKQAADINTETLLSYVNVFSDLITQLKYAANDRILLEVACIKLCNPQTESKGSDIPARLKKIEQLMQSGQLVVKSDEHEQKPQSPPSTPKKIKSMPDDIKNVISQWGKFIKSLDGAESGYFSTAKPKYLDNSVLTIVCESAPIMEHLAKKEKESDFIGTKLLQIFGKEFTISFTTNKDYDAQHNMLYGVDDDFDYGALQNKIAIKIEED